MRSERSHGTVFHAGEGDVPLEALFGQLLDAARPLVDFDSALLVELEEERLAIRARVQPPEFVGSTPVLSDLDRLFSEGRVRLFEGSGEAMPLDGCRHCLVVPLENGGERLGLWVFGREIRPPFGAADIRAAEVLGRSAVPLLVAARQLRARDRLVRFLEGEKQYLEARAGRDVDARDLITVCPSRAMAEITGFARQIAPTRSPVLISGETGTGKEVIAKALHLWSRRADRPMISVNCAALSRELIESELFGHVRGAFTGATRDRIGRFKAADGGTLFLDEVGELPPDLQAKLLRTLENGELEPVGSSISIQVDVRVIAATNVDLLSAVREGRFREDLYYRLAVFPLHLPPLRERSEDIPVIVNNILRDLTGGTGETPHLDPEQISLLQRQSWPGNVRELVNLLRRSLVLSGGGEFTLMIDQPSSDPNPLRTEASRREPLSTLEEMERHHIRKALEQTNGKLYGQGGAAAILGINPNTLRSRMRKLGLGGARNFKKPTRE